MNNAVFGKTIKNVRKHTDIKPVIAKPRNNYLVSKSNYHTKKIFKKMFSHRNEKNPNKYSGISHPLYVYCKYCKYLQISK